MISIAGFFSNSFEVPEFIENDEGKYRPFFGRRLAGFFLILSAEGFYSEQTIKKILELSPNIESKARNRAIDQEKGHKRSPSSQPPILHQDDAKILNEYPFDSIKFTCHGGFRQRKIRDKVNFESRPHFVVTLDPETAGVDLIREYQNSGLEYLKHVNELQYQNLMMNQSNLNAQMSKFKPDSPEMLSLQTKLQEIEFCRAAFSQWFLDNGFEVPVVEHEKVEISHETKNPSIEIAPDFTWIMYKGQRYNFTTPKQRDVFKFLCQNHKPGTPGLGQDFIFTELDWGGMRDLKMSKIFRNSKAWKTLIVAEDGLYRLDISSSLPI